MRPASKNRLRGCARLLAATLIVAALCCAREKKSPADPTALTADERYLVEAYVDVRRAAAYYPHQPAIAESLLSALEGDIDSVRVADTISAVGRDPARWVLVMDAIEKRLKDEAPPEPRSHPDTP